MFDILPSVNFLYFSNFNLHLLKLYFGYTFQNIKFTFDKLFPHFYKLKQGKTKTPSPTTVHASIIQLTSESSYKAKPNQ